MAEWFAVSVLPKRMPPTEVDKADIVADEVAVDTANKGVTTDTPVEQVREMMVAALIAVVAEFRLAVVP